MSNQTKARARARQKQKERKMHRNAIRNMKDGKPKGNGKKDGFFSFLRGKDRK